MNIEIPPKMEEEILKHAEILGRTPEKVVLDFLWTRFSPPVKPKNVKPLPKPKEGETLLDALSDFVGVLGNDEKVKGKVSLSGNTHEKFTKIAVKKHNERSLR